MDDYISKPLMVEDLQRVSHRWQSVSMLQATQPLTTTSVPESSPVDLERLREIVGDDEQGMQELVALYLQQTAADLVKLQAALAGESARDVERLAHSCAGASASCGMVVITPLFKELVHAARDNRLTDGMRWCAAVVEAFEHIRHFFQTYWLPTSPAS
jgi:HPt (histidine-containing phosphotransfer) domain-containing protein